MMVSLLPSLTYWSLETNLASKRKQVRTKWGSISWRELESLLQTDQLDTLRPRSKNLSSVERTASKSKAPMESTCTRVCNMEDWYNNYCWASGVCSQIWPNYVCPNQWSSIYCASRYTVYCRASHSDGEYATEPDQLPNCQWLKKRLKGKPRWLKSTAKKTSGISKGAEIGRALNGHPNIIM